MDAGQVTGANLIGGDVRAGGPATVKSLNPRTGETREPNAHEATTTEVQEACRRAAAASDELASRSPRERARLLRTIADTLDAESAPIVQLADLETGLGATPRLASEFARTTGQLRFLADVVEEGSYLEATIDEQDDGPSIRRCLVPLGPVAVFGASNFPLAFSVAGGDTAAALAVGCPTVVKAHPSHPHTSELVGRKVNEALSAAGAPDGIFSLVHGFDAGQQLVVNHHIKAVGFTGSYTAGRAITELAASRDLPIPVYAEMSSLNPAVVSPAAATERTTQIAQGFVSSFTLGVGQFCTKPGILFVPSSSPQLVDDIRTRAEAVEAETMLNENIYENWSRELDRWRRLDAVEDLLADLPADQGDLRAAPALLVTDTRAFSETPALHEECFGPTAVLVRYDDADDLASCLETLEGNLAASLHSTEGESDFNERIIRILNARAGRLIWNDWPTGVAVTWAMHHGGPYPSTSDPLHTSVGAAALRRFLRPVCFQGLPEPLLPPPLHTGNPLNIPRRVNGQMVLP